MCHMKTISLRELHANTGALVRSAARLGAVLVTDRGKAIARIEPVAEDSAGNPFLRRRILPEFAALKGKLGGGTDSTVLVRMDRDRG
jgi:antitoxin (DNA-binding transcriptional repressor) of toxin-antitoxin stability system